MPANDDILDRIQRDVEAFLASSPMLEGAHVMIDGDKDFTSRLERSFATLKPDDNGKRGLAIIIQPLEMDEIDPNMSIPTGAVTLSIISFEAMSLNRKTTGTGVTAFQSAVRILRLLHKRSFGGSELQGGKNPIIPAPIPDGFSSYITRLSIEFTATAVEHVESVRPSVSGGLLVLACETSGAAIRYTTDGSYPSATATEYTVPVSITAGTIVRAAAYKSGMESSDVLQFTKS